MHNNYFFLRQLSTALDSRLKGFTVVSCFSQNKDELIFEFNNASTSFFIKASLQADFCCLSFPGSFKRARKNSVDLFHECILKKVIEVRQFKNERSFSIELDEDFTLLFKMHANRANAILLKNNIALDLFRKYQSTDLEINPKTMDREINWSKDYFLEHIDKLQQTYFTFGKTVWKYLETKGFLLANIESKWTLFQQTIQQLEKPGYYILEEDHRIIFSLLPYGKNVLQKTDPIDAINEFFYRYTIGHALYKEKSSALRYLHEQLKNSQAYIKKCRLRLNELDTDLHYQVWGDLIMANIHRLKIGEEEVTLDDLFNPHNKVEIKLKKELSPQKNASFFYRKAKNRQIEVKKLSEALEIKTKETEVIQHHLTLLEPETDLKALRLKVEAAGLKKVQSAQPEILPFYEFEHKGFKIWVGKNAESNDKLTLKYSFKEDLWLHAKDVAGSHVIIKYQSGKVFPKDVIKRAAELAAYNSKRKNESLCPVVFTPKKFVRKRKGDPAGAVIVEREEVILAEPRL